MDTDVQTPAAESSPAATEKQPAMQEFVPGIPKDSAARAEWLKTGKKPEAPKKQESAPAEESSDAEEEPSDGESAAAPEAANTQEPKPKRSNAESRIKELLAENKRLKEEASRRQAEPPAKAAESQPAKPAESDLKPPVRPKPEDFTGDDAWERYEEARDKWHEDVADFKAKQAVAEDRKARAEEASQKAMQSRVEEARKRYHDFDEKAGPAVRAIFEDKAIHPAVQQLVNASPVFTDLLYVIGGNEADMADFLSSAKTNPVEAIRKTVLLEQLVMEEIKKGGKSDKDAPKETEGETQERDASGRFKAPQTKISSAPRPTKEVSGRGAAPPDPEEAARQRGDFRGWMKLRNARDLARMKG